MTDAPATDAPAAPPRNARLSRSARRAQLPRPRPGTSSPPRVTTRRRLWTTSPNAPGSANPCSTSTSPASWELYRALLTTCADDLVERVRDAIARTSDNRERVAAAVLGVLRLPSRATGRPTGSSSAPTCGANPRRRPWSTAPSPPAASTTAPPRPSRPTPGSTRPGAAAGGRAGRASQVGPQYWLDSDRGGAAGRGRGADVEPGVAGVGRVPDGARPTGGTERALDPVAGEPKLVAGKPLSRNEVGEHESGFPATTSRQPEPDPPLRRRDLHVRDLVGPHEEAPALVVDELQAARRRRSATRRRASGPRPASGRCGYDQLPRALHDADLDLHRVTSWSSLHGPGPGPAHDEHGPG